MMGVGRGCACTAGVMLTTNMHIVESRNILPQCPQYLVIKKYLMATKMCWKMRLRFLIIQSVSSDYYWRIIFSRSNVIKKCQSPQSVQFLTRS